MLDVNGSNNNVAKGFAFPIINRTPTNKKARFIIGNTKPDAKRADRNAVPAALN